MACEYTKGPWKVVGSGETLFVDGPMDANIDPIEDARHSVATVTGPDRVANANILAATLELLEALKKLLDVVSNPVAQPRIHGRQEDWDKYVLWQSKHNDALTAASSVINKVEAQHDR